MKIMFRVIVAGMILAVPAGPAMAWGPKTQVAIVTTAARVISSDGTIPLTNLERDIQNGASIPTATVYELFPEAEENLIRTIESEMYLLQAAWGNRVDPYLAYRLGILGKLVAQATAPMAELNPLYRALYYADVDRNIEGAVVRPSPRKLVDPPAYFAWVQREARKREDVIQKEYQAGISFDGLAKAALSEDVNRSVDAVADVWHTILTGGVIVANISESHLREYALGALEFYLERGNKQEADITYNRLMAVGIPTPAFRKRIGDTFYEAGEYERAIQEYEAVFAEDATRRDVIEKVAAYYVTVGKDALADGQLETARDAYARAADVDKLHPAAHQKRLQVDSLIATRDMRQETDRQNLDKAKVLESRAEQEMRTRKYAKAFKLLNQADALYRKVSDEFVTEQRMAAVRLNRVAALKRQLRDELINDAERLSGSGAATDARQVATDASQRLNKQVLRALVISEYRAIVDDLEVDLEDSILNRGRSRRGE